MPFHATDLISGSLVNTYDKNVLYSQIKSFFVLQTFWTPAIHAFVITVEHSYRALKSIFNYQWTSGFLSHILLNLSYLKNGIVIVSVTLPRYFNIWLLFAWIVVDFLLTHVNMMLLFEQIEHTVSVVSYKIENFLLKWETPTCHSLYNPSFWWK